jgi:hypothetical protein
MNWKFWKKQSLSDETKATLEFLIHELQDILQNEHCTSTFSLVFELQQLLDMWIKANNLHPEQVQTFRFNATNAYPTSATFTFHYGGDSS